MTFCLVYLVYKQILRTAACPVRPSHIVAICSLSVCWNQVWLVSHYTSNICHWLGPTKISVDVAAIVLGWDDICLPQDLVPRQCGQAPLWHPPWHFGFPYRPIKIHLCQQWSKQTFKLMHAYLLVHEHAYQYVCVLLQVMLKVRTEPLGDVSAHAHLTPLAPRTAFPFHS